MVPIVMVEKWLNKLTEETFLGNLKWSGTVKYEGVVGGYAVELQACEGCVEMAVTQYAPSFGVTVHRFGKKIVAGDFLYPKAEELYELAKSSASHTESSEEKRGIREVHSVLTA